MIKSFVSAVALAACIAAPVSAEVIAGRSAQALRCAAYISAAAKGLQSRGAIDQATYDNLMMATAYILAEKTGMEDPMPAYRQVLSELSSEAGTYERFTQHSEFCQREFLPR